jgi:hypothetical protein
MSQARAPLTRIMRARAHALTAAPCCVVVAARASVRAPTIAIAASVVARWRSYLMAVRIQEAYTFDAHGRIVRLERCMANAAQAKLVTA